MLINKARTTSYPPCLRKHLASVNTGRLSTSGPNTDNIQSGCYLKVACNYITDFILLFYDLRRYPDDENKADLIQLIHNSTPIAE